MTPPGMGSALVGRTRLGRRDQADAENTVAALWPHVNPRRGRPVRLWDSAASRPVPKRRAGRVKFWIVECLT